MNKIVPVLVRVLIIVAGVVLITALSYFLTGGRTSRGLSDWLVYASFLTFGAGTLAGISRAGFKGEHVNDPAAPDSGVEGLAREFLRAGPLGISVTLAGVVCFLLAILADGLF